MAMEWEDKKILVVGLGRSGIAGVKALHQLGADVYVQDSTKEENLDAATKELLASLHITGFFGEVPDASMTFDMMVLSPGVPPALAFIRKAAEKGTKIIGELELAYLVGKGKYVAITGTNGKTTTTSLVGEIFRCANLKSAVVGNIGIPAVTKAMEADEDTWMIAEVSSFQLETIDTFCPEVSAILNVTPDHLNRHGSMEGYKMAKARIFENQTEDQYVVMNLDDEESFSMATGAKAVIVPFSRKETLPLGAYLKGDRIVLKTREEKLVDICGVEELQIPGSHNLENALAATAICYFAGVDPAAIAAGLRTFKGVPHRIEDCGTVHGVRYYNDSKGTNTDAAIKAIEAMDAPIVLIAGGYDKGSDFEDLIRAFQGKVKRVVLMGTTAVKIKMTAEKLGFTNTIITSDMAGCVREATASAEEGDVVLLSPACASWDMYDNFEQRGDDFKKCVQELQEGK